MNLRRPSILASICIIIFSLYCTENNVNTDITEHSSVNTYINAKDLKNGIKKTSSSMFPVKLSHEAHQKHGIQCVECHHKTNNSERIKDCAFCHKGIQGAAHLHKVCKGCHEKVQKGPVQCSGCHAEEKELTIGSAMEKVYSNTILYGNSFHESHKKSGIACTECHHNDISGKEDKKCSICHKGVSRMRIMHSFCKDCHQTRNTRTGDVKHPIRCEGCHKVKEEDISHYRYKVIDLPKTGHRKPGIRFYHEKHIEEYKTECIDCHHTGQNLKCSECHKKNDQGEVINLKGAFHQQCHDCHRKTSGPKGCSKCHRIEEKK